MSWMFTCGTLKAHYVKDGKSICGSSSKFEPSIAMIPECAMCKKCAHKLELI